MAKAKTQLFSEISGSFKQGVTFRKLPNKAKQIFQRKPIPSYTRTDKQDNVRTGYKRLCDIWKKAEWLDKTVYTNFADIYKITPFNAWMKFNMPIMSRKPVLYLGMDEGQGTTAHDYSTAGNDGEIVGATWETLPTGKHVLSFDGIDDYVETTDIGNGSQLTVFTWVRIKETGDWKGIICKQGRSSIADEVSGWRILYATSQDLVRTYLKNTEGKWVMHDIKNKKWDEWNFYAFTWDNDEFITIFNDEIIGISTITGTVSNNYNVTLGVTSTLGNYCKCKIGSAGVYEIGVKPESIINLYEKTRHLFGV